MNNLIKAINELKKEKNAIILGHYYQKGEIQDIADYVGDSLALAQLAAKTEADIIVMCGVHFMGETAKVLCPDKKVLVPDMEAGCSLADSCPADQFAQFVKEHPGHTVISYVNTTAAVKAVTDVVVTSTNARQIVESFPKDEKMSQSKPLPLEHPRSSTPMPKAHCLRCIIVYSFALSSIKYSCFQRIAIPKMVFLHFF